MRIHLDHNAGAPLRPQARAAMERFIADGCANPSSVHRGGQLARKMLEQAREQVAVLIGAQAREVVFVSGGTEANNLAIRAVPDARGRSGIVSSAIEHSSILRPLDEARSRGCNTVRLTPDAAGRLDPGAVIDALDSNTALVTLALANSETGTVQDIAAMNAAVRDAGALFHIDAAQAVGRMRVNVPELGCDLMTLSGHKLGGPTGIGALFVREGVAVSPMILGGPQERGLRAGTQNTMGAVGFGAAAAAVSAQLEEETSRVGALADGLMRRLFGSIPGLRLNGPVTGRIPNTLNLEFPGVLGESMLIALDLAGVEVAMGSACAAGSVEPSHVLRAMGASRDRARSSLRLSLGWSTAADEIARAAEIIATVWRRVRDAEPAAAGMAAP